MVRFIINHRHGAVSSSVVEMCALGEVVEKYSDAEGIEKVALVGLI